MENKKSKKADLENKRGSVMLLGLVFGSSLALMSFEYARFDLIQEDDLMSSVNSEEMVWEFSPPKIEYKPSQPIQEVSKSDYVEASTDPEPIITVEPEPIVPVDPGPVIGPPGPVVGVYIPEEKPKFEDNKEYVIVEEMPEFPGGIEEMYKFLSKNIKYPQQCMDNNVQGIAYVKFTVEKDGSISNITTYQEKTVHSLLDKEAMRVVGLMPSWKPGKQLNKTVRVSYTLPINFVLEN